MLVAHGSTHGSHFAAHSSHHASEHDDVCDDGENGAADDVQADKDGVGPWEVFLLDSCRVGGRGKKNGLVEARFDGTVEDLVVLASILNPFAGSFRDSLESSSVELVESSTISSCFLS